MHYQTIWLILLIVFAGIEGITAGLVSIWFCAGSLVALVATWLGASLPVQIGLFAIVSVVAMALVRPMARKWLHPKYGENQRRPHPGSGRRGGGGD